MTKCDACLDRLAKSEKPVCVAACPQRALDFGYIDELKVKYGAGENIQALSSPSVTKPNLIVRHREVSTPVKQRPDLPSRRRQSHPACLTIERADSCRYRLLPAWA